MVDINESYQAIAKTPDQNIKQKRSFVYKLFFDKTGAPKPIRVISYAPGFKVPADEITVIKNLKIKLRKNYIVEQDFVVIPSRSGDIYLPISEINDFCNEISSLTGFVKGDHEKEIRQ